MVLMIYAILSTASRPSKASLYASPSLTFSDNDILVRKASATRDRRAGYTIGVRRGVGEARPTAIEGIGGFGPFMRPSSTARDCGVDADADRERVRSDALTRSLMVLGGWGMVRTESMDLRDEEEEVTSADRRGGEGDD